MILLISWAALFGGNWVLAEPIKTYYGTHYARAFTIPSGAMEPTLLVGDYILTNNSTYRVQDPQRGDIIVFKYPQDESRGFVRRDKIVGRAFTIYWSWDRVQFWPRLDRVGRSL